MLINFSDTATAFRNKSDFLLRKSYVLFSVMGSNRMVKVGKQLSNFAFNTGLPVKGLIKSTVFNQFCGGESIKDCSQSIDELIAMGVGSILDYSVEGKETESDFDKTKDTVIRSIEYAADKTGVPIAVFKPTGMGRFALWEKKSAQHKLSEEEQAEWDRIVQRFHDIALAAHRCNIPVMVDAEESWIQQAVDELVRELMMEHNREKVVILNTFQMYRHDRLAFLQNELKHAE